VREPQNNAFDRTAGSHSLATAGQRERYAHRGEPKGERRNAESAERKEVP